MARDNNLVAKINVNEYVGGSFTGTFSFSGNDYVLSKVVCDYATTISNANGKIVNFDVAIKIIMLLIQK